MRTLCLTLLSVLAVGCAPTLHLTYPTAPEGTLGAVRTLSVSVTTDVGKAVENAVVTGLALGELPVPVPVDDIMKERLVARLEQLGFTVCPVAPCGDGEMTVRLTEAAVGTELTTGGLRTHSRITARVKVKQVNGQEPFDFVFRDRRTGRVEEAPLLVRNGAESIAASFAQTLTPGSENVRFPIEDGGALSMGVNILLSNNWDGAVNFFTQLTRDQPELPGAWYDLGLSWAARGDWGQALPAFERAAAFDRKHIYRDAVQVARRMAPRAAAVPQPLPAGP